MTLARRLQADAAAAQRATADPINVRCRRMVISVAPVSQRVGLAETAGGATVVADVRYSDHLTDLDVGDVVQVFFADGSPWVAARLA